jgi:hypothetical protein
VHIQMEPSCSIIKRPFVFVDSRLIYQGVGRASLRVTLKHEIYTNYES